MRILLLTMCLLSSALCHDYYPGECPNFSPMSGFDWTRFSAGIWYVTQKFDTKSSCLTYEFKTDNLGFKEIVQVRKLPLLAKTGLEHEYVYKGKLYAPSESTPAKMVVRFPLNVAGASSFVVLATDYDSHGLICTCQDFDAFFAKFHRRSCSILQRDQTENTDITQQMMQKLNTEIDDASHDFDKIKQEGCDYSKDTVLTIDVDKIIGGGSDDDESGFGDFEPDAELINTNAEVQEILRDFDTDQLTVNEIKQDAEGKLKK